MSTSLGAGHQIGQYQHLMQRVDEKQLKRCLSRPSRWSKKTTPGGKPPDCAHPIGIDDFAKVDCASRAIVECKAVEGSTKLLQLTLDAGEGKTRAMCSAASPACTSLEATCRQADGAGGQPGAAQDEVRRLERRRGAGRQPPASTCWSSSPAPNCMLE